MAIRKNIIKERSFSFALEIIKLVQGLPKNTACFELGKQLMRFGTSIGASIEEAIGASSKKDFIHKINISKKEARETHYWLKLLSESQLTHNAKIQQLINESNELINILTSIVKTSEKQKKQ